MSELNKIYDPNVYPGNLLIALAKFGNREPLKTLPADWEVSLEYVITNGLTEREAGIVKLRYQQGMTYDSIGKVYGVTRERVRQIDAKALRKLRHPSRWRYIQYGINGVVDSIKETAFQEGYQRGIQFGYKKAIADAKANSVNHLEYGDLKLEDLDLSVRSFNCMYRAGVKCAVDIVDMGYRGLVLVRGFGKRSYDEVIEKLAQFGYDVSNLLPPEGEA